MKARITQHLITTSLGSLLLVVGVVLLCLREITVAELVTLTPLVGVLLLSKDDFLKQT